MSSQVRRDALAPGRGLGLRQPSVLYPDSTRVRDVGLSTADDNVFLTDLPSLVRPTATRTKKRP